MRQPLSQRIKMLLPFAALPLILLMAWGLVAIAQPLPVQRLYGEYVRVGEALDGSPNYLRAGTYDLRGFDFENYIAFAFGTADDIRRELLTPEEFYAWDGEIRRGREVGGYIHYLTTRTRFLVEDGKWYTFSRLSIDHSHRLYVNGELLLSIGEPGKTPDSNTPLTGRITFTAQSVDGVIELIQQSSNHVHRFSGANSHANWYIGTGTALSDAVRAEQYQTNIILGSFLMLTLLFVMLFFTYNQTRTALFFALFCMTWFMRVGVTGGRVFTVIFPWMDWFTQFRIEYMAIPVSAALTLAIVDVLFPKVFHKPVLYTLYGITAIFSALFLFLDTISMRYVLDLVFVVYGLGIVYAAGCLVIRQFIIRRKISPEQGVFVIGLLLFFIASLTDFGYLEQLFHTPPFHLTGVAMLVFALCMAVSVFTSAMKEAEYTKTKSLRLAADNAALESQSRMKTEFLGNLSHEIKTPLTVILSDIQRIGREIHKHGLESERVSESINRARDEIMRMARLTDSAIKMAAMQEHHDKMDFINAALLFTTGAEGYRSIIEKQGNRLIINAQSNLPLIYGNVDRLLGVLSNLLTNANKHTKNGEISVNIKLKKVLDKNRFVSVTVKDNGTGITPEMLPHVFERGVSGSGSTGMGLAICKSIVEAHGGEIEIKSEAGKGTEVSFSLAIYNKERTDDGDV